MRRLTTSAAIGSGVGVAYGLLACVLTWPLPRHLRTELLGPTSADLGTYVWNFWIFGHELLRHSHLPFSTNHVFAYTGGADFALHNYTPVAGLLGLPLIPVLGLVGAFNLVLMVFVAASGWAVFILARRLGLGTLAAWSAGALFMASPALVARQTAHFSLVIAAPLPLFLWALLRTLDTRRIRDAMLTGVIVAVASYSDAYYGVYCALMGALVVGWRLTSVEWHQRAPGVPRVARGLNVAIALVAILIAWRVSTGVTLMTVGPVRIRLQTLYTPALALVLLGTIRAWLMWRPTFRLDVPLAQLRSLARLGLIAVVCCLTLLLPVIVGIGWRFLNDRLPETQTYWRSSPRGVDLLAYLVPNPNHPWFGERTSGWFISEWADAYPEFVASFSLVALTIVAVGAWYRSLPPFWVAFTGFFVAVSLGPFVHIAGINTYVIGPWALLRYVPIIEMTRAPARFAIVAALGFSLLFAFSVEALSSRLRRRGRASRYAMAGVVAVALTLELIPAPRRLYSAAVPSVYEVIATTDEASGRLLDLPTGIRDGVESLGNFSASSQYFQTTHQRQLIGGYLSRVSRKRKRDNEQTPMLKALLALSQGEDVTPAETRAAQESRDEFLARSCVKWVVLNKQSASPQLRAFAVDVLRLSAVHEDPDYVLLTPTDPPACQPGPPSFTRPD